MNQLFQQKKIGVYALTVLHEGFHFLQDVQSKLWWVYQNFRMTRLRLSTHSLENARRALDNDCKVSSWIGFRQFYWSIQQQLPFSKAELQSNFSEKTTRSPRCMRFLHNLFSIWFVQVSTRGDNRCSWCYCTLFYKYFHVFDYQLFGNVQFIHCICSSLYILINFLKLLNNLCT